MAVVGERRLGELYDSELLWSASKDRECVNSVQVKSIIL